MNEVQLAHKIQLLEMEVGNLGDDLQQLRREQRAQIDRLELELEVLRVYLKGKHVEFAEQLPGLLDRVRMETVPE